MAGSDSDFQVVYRGEYLTYYVPGGWVFFQRSKESGGGFWFGRTFDGLFLFEFTAPVSLSLGLAHLQTLKHPGAVIYESVQPDDSLPLF